MNVTQPHPSVEDSYLEYPQRRYGMDHERYAWSMLADRKPVVWPNGSKLAVWVNLSLEHFPLNPTSPSAGKPVKLPGGMTMPYPDLRHYTLRDYGNRVGIYRLLKACDQTNVTPTIAINAALVSRYPQLAGLIRERGDEVIAHSWSMDTAHVGGLDEAAEAALIQQSMDTLSNAFGKTPTGWLSPGKLESANTPDLIKAAGIEYFCDWVNDDMPYAFHTKHGDLVAMPLSTEIEDRFIVIDNFQSEQSWAEQVMDACELLLAEANEQGGRILSIPLHAWVMGQPHRIKHVEAVLAHVMSKPGVWNASAGEICATWRAQQTAASDNKAE
ncbi:MAG: polysaccharide deacetylase family protein [Aeromicrobium sp.]|nr:polysaccharide deacetylase family protein [Burkholderiales bacterium]